jgi:hypothetical protein
MNYKELARNWLFVNTQDTSTHLESLHSLLLAVAANAQREKCKDMLSYFNQHELLEEAKRVAVRLEELEVHLERVAKG